MPISVDDITNPKSKCIIPKDAVNKNIENMITYAQKEMIGITELSKGLSKMVDQVASHTIEKLAVVKRNKPEVVMLPIDEYEYLKD